MADQPERRRRGLVLAGGGLKVAYQAGVLQVWLDEALADGKPLDFVTADGASGGCFNLALWCMGLTGGQIADRWRGYRPARGALFNLGLPFRPALLRSAAIASRSLPDLGINMYELKNGSGQSGPRHATFNVWDVTEQKLETFSPDEMSYELLVAATSPPMWFPAVRTGGRTYTDSVFATDGNLIAALKLDADGKADVDELWVIWTVSTAGQWRTGFNREYFQLVETAANSRLRSDLDRINANNDACRKSPGSGEFGREILVRLLTKEVPVEYLLTLRNSTLASAVDLGVRDAREWCLKQGFALAPPADNASSSSNPVEVSFRETMRGYLIKGAKDPRRPPKVKPENDVSAALRMTVKIGDMARFTGDDRHEAVVEGEIILAGWNATCDIRGTVLLLTDVPGQGKQMVYELNYRDPDGNQCLLHGVKRVLQGGFVDSWPETTTMFTQITVNTDSGKQPMYAGVLRISLLGFLHELGTFRSTAPRFTSRARAVARYGEYFADQLSSVRRDRLRPPTTRAAWLDEYP